MSNNTVSEIALLTACAKLAAHVVASYRQEFPRCEDVVMCGDSPVPSTSESMASILQAYKDNIPGLAAATNAQLLPVAEAQYASDAAMTPKYNQLALDTYENYGPALNKVGTDIARQNALATAQAESDVLAGPGQELIKQGLAAAKLADPEYYATREAMSSKLNQALAAMSPELSAAETEALNRGIAQSNMQRGMSTSPSQLTTVSNAMQFGNAATKKASDLAAAISQASQSLGQFRSGIDPFQVATGRSSGNTGENKFAGTSTNTGANANVMGSNLLNSATSVKNAEVNANANKRDSLDRAMQTIGGVSSLIGSFRG